MTREGNRGASDTPPRGRGGRGYPLLASIALAVAALVLVLFILEIGVRWYAWSIGRGFWENPHDFVSPFFTSDGWPAPYHEGNTLVFKEGERVLRGKPTGRYALSASEARRRYPAPTRKDGAIRGNSNGFSTRASRTTGYESSMQEKTRTRAPIAL